MPNGATTWIEDKDLDFSNAVKGIKTPKVGWDLDEHNSHEDWMKGMERLQRARARIKENERRTNK